MSFACARAPEDDRRPQEARQLGFIVEIQFRWLDIVLVVVTIVTGATTTTTAAAAGN